MVRSEQTSHYQLCVWAKGNRLEVVTSRKNGGTMPILRIQHSVPSFEGWKRAYDSDPLDRKGSGVRRHRVYRAVADPNLVMIDLELDTVAEAELLLGRLRQLWAGPGAALMKNPEAWILETVESASV